jgi:hypothetical protein
MSAPDVKVRLIFADEGSYHVAEVSIPRASLDGYDRLIDCIREDPVVLGRLHVDVERLCAAHIVDGA